MAQAPVDALIDLVYEAAVEPQLWLTVMERTADAIGGAGAWLSQLNMRDGAGGGLITRIDPAMPALYASHYALKNPLSNVADPEGYLRAWTPRVLTDEDWMPKEALLASEYYNDFLKPQDIHSTVMIRLARRGENVATLNINRTQRQPQYGSVELEWLEALHPHLIRAFRLTQTFADLSGLKRGLVDTLDASPRAYFLLDEAGRIRHANAVAERLLERDRRLIVRASALAASAPRDSARLARLIAGALAQRGAGAGSATLSAADRAPLLVEVAPIAPAQLPLPWFEVRAVVCVADAGGSAGPSHERLRALFGLTDAEARVALALLEGATPKDAARRFGVSLNTIRTQLARTYEKTGARGQADLMRLLTRVAASSIG